MMFRPKFQFLFTRNSQNNVVGNSHASIAKLPKVEATPPSRGKIKKQVMSLEAIIRMKKMQRAGIISPDQTFDQDEFDEMVAIQDQRKKNIARAKTKLRTMTTFLAAASPRASKAGIEKEGTAQSKKNMF